MRPPDLILSGLEQLLAELNDRIVVRTVEEARETVPVAVEQQRVASVEPGFFRVTQAVAVLVRRGRLESDREEVDARVRTLEASPEMRGKQALDRARIQAEKSEADLARARKRTRRVRLESEVSKGSRFILVLPAVLPDASEPEDSDDIDAPPDARPAKKAAASSPRSTVP